MAKQTIRLFLFLTLLNDFGISFVSSTYVMFLLFHGLDLFEVNLVNVAFYLTRALFEIPTGAIADVFGRKASFVLSCFFHAIGMFVYFVSTSFWGFVLAEVIVAIGWTLSSGAFQAWLVDRLKFFGFNESFSSIFAKGHSISRIGTIFGALLGAYCADIYTALPWFGGGCILAIAGAFAIILMKEEYFTRDIASISSSLKSIKNTINVSIEYSLNNKTVKFIFLVGTLNFFIVQAPNMQWQPFFGAWLESKFAFGFVFSGISVCLIIGSLFSSRILKWLKHEKRTFIVIQIFTGLGLIISACATKLYFGLSVFLAHEIARGAFLPIKDTYLNAQIPSKERATLISCEGMMSNIGGMFGLLISGALAKYMSISFTWIVFGCLMIIGMFYLSKRS